VNPAVRGSSRIGRAIQYASFADRATRRLRDDRSAYDIIDVAGTTAWEHDVIRCHAVQKRELGRWPSRGGQTFRAAKTRARFAPLLHPRMGVAGLIEQLQFRQGRFARVIAVTDEVKQDLIEVYGLEDERIRVIAPAIDTDAFAAAKPGTMRAQLGLGAEPVALFVGHDFQRKGLADAIEAVAALDSVHLVVVGNGRRDSFERQAALSGIGDRVHFVGATSKPEIAFADADLLLLPTHEDVWGNTLIEALAAGLPVVTTTIAGASKIVEQADAGITVPPASPRELRAALELVLETRTRRDDLGARARRAAAAFGVDAHAARVLDVYEQILRERTRNSTVTRKFPPRKSGVSARHSKNYVRVALVYEEFRLDRSLARDRVLIARALRDRGLEVHVYCNPAERGAEADGVVFHDVVPLPRAPTRFGRALEYGSFAVAATRRLRAERSRYDVVDVAGTTAWEHDVIRAHAVQKAEQRRWPQRGGRGYRLPRVRASLTPMTQPRIALAQAIERLQYRPGHFKRVLAVTEGVKADLQKVHGIDPELIEVVAYPVETNRFAGAERGLLRRQLRLGSDDKVALFVGHDYERKGLSEAIGGVARADDNVILVVVGEADPTRYKSAAVELGIGDRVHFVGATGTPEAYLGDADVLLLPTREDVWGVTVVEAMAAGIPVIVSDVAGAAEVIRNAQAGLVIEGSSPEVGNALRIVLSDRDRARAMGDRGRTAAARFDVVRIADEVAAAYEHIVRQYRDLSGSQSVRESPLR
jgi:UDP-glucose:(heptosyl)LPS alpha-1,3-glucosyltransferase